MAVGTTTDSRYTRDSVINDAYKTIGNPNRSGPEFNDAIPLLNAIIREADIEDNLLWVVETDPTSITLQVNIATYTTSEGLPNDIKYLDSVYFHDSNGSDSPVTILTPQGYADLVNKFEQGSQIEKCYLTDHREWTSRELRVWPVMSSINSQSEVIGPDTNNYQCIVSHVAEASTNKPITGTNWRLYWQLGGSSGAVWVAGTSYTAPQLLRIKHKRPLYDFDLPTDNPDMPPGWGLVLMFQLAYVLSFRRPGLPVAFRESLRQEVALAKSRVNLGQIKVTTDYHNRSIFF